MDPVTVVSLVASALGVADISARLGVGLHRLQQEFKGALEHVDDISQQADTIDFAIREICSLLRRRPETFPTSFESRFNDLTKAVDRVVAQIQHHIQSVRNEANRSPSRGKVYHVRHAAAVTQWEKTLTVQIQALSFLLQVAQMLVVLPRFHRVVVADRQQALQR